MPPKVKIGPIMKVTRWTTNGRTVHLLLIGCLRDEDTERALRIHCMTTMRPIYRLCGGDSPLFHLNIRLRQRHRLA